MKPVHALVCETRLPICLALTLGLLALAVRGEERLGSVQDMYDGALPLQVEVNTFRHIDRVFPSVVVKSGGRVFPFPQAKRQLRDVTFGSIGRQLHLADYIRLNRVAGVLVLKDGQIALERYEFGNTPQTRWVSFSVVKSITSGDELFATAPTKRLRWRVDPQCVADGLGRPLERDLHRRIVGPPQDAGFANQQTFFERSFAINRLGQGPLAEHIDLLAARLATWQDATAPALEL